MLSTRSLLVRYFIAAAIIWVAAVWMWVFVFNPFGPYWAPTELIFAWKLCFAPIAFAALCVVVISLARRQPNV